MTDTFDYVIVGAGSAGSVIAGRLAEDARTTLCVLEAGPPDRNIFIHVPAGFMRTFVNPDLNWMYESEPGPATGGRIVAAPRGKTLGGSSSINGHVYSRGQRADYDTWAQQGNRGWGFADVLPYFKRAERRVGPADDRFRGREGGLVVTDSDWSHPLCEAFIDGAIGLGIPLNPDYNGAVQEGVSYTQRIIHRRRRVSSYRAFLHGRRGQANVDIRTRAHAARILIEDGRAVGVRYLRDGETVDVMARREVILSGGTVNSPQLLQLSDIGPGGLLNEIGVDVVRDHAGVGENLRDHYAVRMTARVKGTDTINELSRGLPLAGEVLKLPDRQAQHPRPRDDAGLRLLAQPSGAGERRHPGELHAGELQGRGAEHPRGPSGCLHRRLAATARKPGPRPRALGRSARKPAYPAELRGGGGRPANAFRRHPPRSANPPLARDGDLSRRRQHARDRRRKRRRTLGADQGTRHYRFPPDGNLPGDVPGSVEKLK